MPFARNSLARVYFSHFPNMSAYLFSSILANSFQLHCGHCRMVCQIKPIIHFLYASRQADGEFLIFRDEKRTNLSHICKTGSYDRNIGQSTAAFVVLGKTDNVRNTATLNAHTGCLHKSTPVYPFDKLEVVY